MSTKALKTQLLAAIAMVLVASIALGSSTYAWFASNNKVEAKSMSFNATTSKNLAISNSANGAFDTTAAAVYTEAMTLRPASTEKLSGTPAFFKNSDGKVTSITDGALVNGAVIESAMITPITAGVTNTEIKDVLKYTFYVKSLNAGDTFANLKIDSITLTGAGASKDISKALRVGVVCGDNSFIYAPVNGYTENYKAVVKAGTFGTTDGVLSTNNVVLKAAPTTGGTDVLATSVDNTAKTIDIYVWYEGQDGSCTSANAIYTDSINMTMSFVAE